MTFDQIVSRAMGRLNITSTEGQTRIGQYVNDRYQQLTSSIGIQTARRTQASAATVASNPRVTFALDKIEQIYATTSGQRRVLDEITYDQWRNLNVYGNASGTPQCYAIEAHGASTVTIVLDPVPSGVETLTADGMATASTLSGSNVPAFPESFHDALVLGAMADEYAKLDKLNDSLRHEKKFEDRVSDLRFFLAKSGYLQRKQGDSSAYKRWNPHIVP